jgi:HTH-type transcriptional regulator/antitoxin HigA
MIRALHEGLGIPAEVLIRTASSRESPEAVKPAVPDWSRMPIKEMARRGWISVKRGLIGSEGPLLAEQFVMSAAALGGATGYRRSVHERAKNASDPEALLAWTSRALLLASACRTERYKVESLTEEFLTKVARLSSAPNGPARARDLLAFTGIPLVFEEHLEKTYLDGCSFLLKDGRPGIALTLRYDRLDNFWFTLLHELSHVLRHVSEEKPLFVDDIQDATAKDADEREADHLAGEALLPRRIWNRSEASRAPSRPAIGALASELSIHPAIIVGRIHRDSKDYRLFRDMVGQGEVSRILGVGKFAGGEDDPH